jgi:hypothetical protein
MDRNWTNLSLYNTGDLEQIMTMVENAISYVSTVPMNDDARDEALWIMDSAHSKLCAQLDETY